MGVILSHCLWWSPKTQRQAITISGCIVHKCLMRRTSDCIGKSTSMLPIMLQQVENECLLRSALVGLQNSSSLPSLHYLTTSVNTNLQVFLGVVRFGLPKQSARTLWSQQKQISSSKATVFLERLVLRVHLGITSDSIH